MANEHHQRQALQPQTLLLAMVFVVSSVCSWASLSLNQRTQREAMVQSGLPMTCENFCEQMCVIPMPARAFDSNTLEQRSRPYSIRGTAPSRDFFLKTKAFRGGRPLSKAPCYGSGPSTTTCPRHQAGLALWSPLPVPLPTFSGGE